jgi:hypothetical protein
MDLDLSSEGNALDGLIKSTQNALNELIKDAENTGITYIIH